MRKNILVLAAIFSTALLLLGLWGFIDNQTKMDGTFETHTTINGVDCSDMSVEEAGMALSSEWNSREFVINADGEHIKDLKGMKFKYTVTNALSDVMVHSGMHPLLTWITKGYGHIQIPMTIAKVDIGFIRQVNKVRFVKKADYKKTRNAYVDMSTTDFPIVAEVYGNNVDKDKLLKKILSNIERGSFVLNAIKSDYYVKPSILSDDPELLAKQEMYRNNFAFKITYDFGYNTEVVTPKVLSGMLNRDGDTMRVRNDKVVAFISNLANKYDTAGMSRYFYDSSGSKVSVYGRDYGYLINRQAEIQWLTQALMDGKSVRHAPKYLPTARSHSNPAVGSSYVEIDLTNQHLWIYKNSRLVLSTPVVTGNVAKGTATPPGTFSIYFMQLDRVLKGEDWDGTTYETPVEFWMAFYGGIGLHDAPWRYAFGGTIYKQNGSHGCINMPPKMAEAAYSMLNIGFPVIVHN